MDSSAYRERFALALAHKAADRPPMDLAGTDMTMIEGGPRRLAPHLGIGSAASGEELDELVLQALDIDIRCVGHVLSPESPLARRISATEVSDCWGIVSEFNGHHYEAVGRPLEGASVDDLEKYPWPKPENINPELLDALERKAKIGRAHV